MTTPAQLERIVACLTKWEDAEFEEKQFTLDKLINCVRIKKGNIEIEWKI